jgi:hypothetical protein
LGVSAAASLSLYLCLLYLVPEGEDHITWLGCAATDLFNSAHRYFFKHHEDSLYPLWVPITFIALLVIMSIAKKLYIMIAHMQHAVSQEVPPQKGWCDHIGMAEYARQTKDYTEKQTKALLESQGYQEMMAEKGPQESVWNWQKRIQRSKKELKEELEYLKNVEAVSHPELSIPCSSVNFQFNNKLPVHEPEEQPIGFDKVNDSVNSNCAN